MLKLKLHVSDIRRSVIREIATMGAVYIVNWTFRHMDDVSNTIHAQ